MKKDRIKKTYILYLKKALIPGIVMALGLFGTLGFTVSSLAGCDRKTVVSEELEEVSASEDIDHTTDSEDAGDLGSTGSDQDSDEQQTSDSTEKNRDTDTVSESEENVQSSNGECVVYVCGAVVQPGVYTLPAGARIEKAVSMAGGFTQEACTYYLNLAQLPEDGMQIYVPTQMEVDSGSAPFSESAVQASPDETLVNINTADLEELMTLPGIGESRARSIIDYRNEHGSFSSIEELKNISGIKEATFSKIKDYIRV